MLKLFQFLSAFLVFGILSFAQPGQVFFDNFDSYLHWQMLVAQNPIDWQTFSRPYTISEDPFVSEAQSFSGSNSVVFITENDIVYLTPAVYTDRVYIISFMIYVPTGSSGEFGVLQHFIPDPSSSYGIIVFMPSGGIGTTDAGGIGSATFNFPHDSWFECKVEVDLDNDLGRFIVNSNLVIEWQWSTGNTGNNNLNQLEGAVFCCATNFLDDFSVVDLLAVPVELTSFTANVNAEGNVLLNWTTATETNNQMFEIERKNIDGHYATIGYVDGYGTTTEPQEYSYIDNTIGTGTYFYRLKQIDFGGQYEYSDEIEVEVNGPLTFGIEQNYPNPFNPSTYIKYSIAKSNYVKLAVYNLIGEEVNVLVSGQLDVGFYEIEFDATNLPSGIYFYRLRAGNFVETKKMVLFK